jgi:hypothetical protein
MAYCFGDGFDCYAAIGDTVAGYWDSGPGGSILVAGRFAGGQAMQLGSGVSTAFTKSSGQNDAVHHLVVAYKTASLVGVALGTYIQFIDNVTNQCCIVFRQDGTILLTSATPAGTVLATYSGAVTAQNTWTAFEFEVVINNVSGSFKVRKNGSTTDNHSTTGINTRPGANAYANKITVGTAAVSSTNQIDDLFWRSDATTVPWVGDIRCITRMPASDASAQFSRAPATIAVANSATNAGTLVKAANAGMMSVFTAPYSGMISSGTVTISVGGTGNMKAAIYDATRTTVLATSNPVVNPTTGANAITFVTPLAVTKGTVYYLATDQDFSITYNVTNTTNYIFTTAYASFPAASPALTGSQSAAQFFVNIVPAVNADLVNETLQDGTTSYVYSSTPGHADLYNVAGIPSTPVATIAVTARAFMQKSDAGARTAAVQMKSGATTVTSNTATLASSSWGWTWRTELLDPATGAAWTAAAVNNVTIGPVVIA